MSRAFFDIVRNFLVDECFVVSIPKRLVIRNLKLGILLRVAQVVFFLALAFFCFAGQVWQNGLSPAPWITEFWLEEPLGAEDRMRLHNRSVRHCNNPRSYWESGGANIGPGRQALRPHGCEALTSFEASWQDNKRLFIPTLIQEMEVFGGELCGSNSTSMLELPPGASLIEHCTDTNGPNPRSCNCRVERTFLAQNPEQQRIVLRHGYSVDLSSKGHHAAVQHSIMSPVFRTQVPGEPVQDEQGDLLTIILAADGSPCKVGGRSEWSPSEAQWGITGTLGEWLMCAGVELDAAPEILLPGASGLARHFRTMGLVLQMRLDYQIGYHGVRSTLDKANICFVSLQPQVQWTTVPTVHDRLFLPQQGGGLLHAERVRKQYGVMLTTTVSGQYYRFDMRKLTSAIVELIVLFEIPLMIVRFLALYCLGFISQVYRRARVTQFSIYSHFHGAIARMMLAEMGFRGLMGGFWKGKVVTTELLTLRQVTSHVQDIFQEQVKLQILKAEDVDRIATVAFMHMRKTRSSHAESGSVGGVSCHDYVRSCTADDTMDVAMMTKVLARETADVTSCISCFFDVNWRSLRADMNSALDTESPQGSVAATVPLPTDEASHFSSLNSSRSNTSKLSQHSISNYVSMSHFAQKHLQQQQEQQQPKQPLQPLQPQRPLPTPTTILKNLESPADIATAGIPGTTVKARGLKDEEENDIENQFLRRLQSEQATRDLEGNIACVRQDLEAKHDNLREEVEKLCCVVKDALEVSAGRIHDLEEKVSRLGSRKRNGNLVNSDLLDNLDKAAIEMVNVNATAVAAVAASAVAATQCDADAVKMPSPRKQAEQGSSGNYGVNAVLRKSPRAFRRFTEGFLSPGRNRTTSQRRNPQRSVSPGPIARRPSANPPKLRNRRTAAAAVALEPMALCPPSTQEARSAVLVLSDAPPKELPPQDVPAEEAPATLLQQSHTKSTSADASQKQPQPQLQARPELQEQRQTPLLQPVPQQQLQETQESNKQIQIAGATPRTTDREILSMPLSQLVRISADPKARAEPEATAVLAPTAGPRELLEAQFWRAARASLPCSSGQEDMSRGDRQEQTAAGPLVLRPPLSGGGPKPLSPPKRLPIQVLAPLEEAPDIEANGIAKGQLPTLEGEINAAEIDERAPSSSAAIGTRGASSSEAQGHDMFVERDQSISSWASRIKKKTCGSPLTVV